jgi:hypothetical protein
MADKPSYKMAYDARKAERKGTGTIEVEGAIDATKPKTFTDKSLESPKKPGMPDVSIAPEPKAESGRQKEVRPAIAHPDDVVPPPDIVKT